MKRERKPTHPGEILEEDYIKPLQLNLSVLAASLGISRTTLYRIRNKRGRVTPDIALKFAIAFNTSPDLWLNLQHKYDLWLLLQKKSVAFKIRQIYPPAKKNNFHKQRRV